MVNFQVNIRNKKQRDMVINVINTYITELKLRSSRYSLQVFAVADLVKIKGINAGTMLAPDKEILLGFDPTLKPEVLCRTLAHEMVHAKQFAKGQLRGKFGRTKMTYTWMGKKCRKTYYNQPWEIEAFSKESLLTNAIIQKYS